jgi:hypothetical protein
MVASVATPCQDFLRPDLKAEHAGAGNETHPVARSVLATGASNKGRPMVVFMDVKSGFVTSANFITSIFD